MVCSVYAIAAADVSRGIDGRPPREVSATESLPISDREPTGGDVEDRVARAPAEATLNAVRL